MKRRHKWIFGLIMVVIVAGGIYAITNGSRDVERVTIRGIAFSETGEEMIVGGDEEVALFVSAFEHAERSVGAVKGIGNNLTFTFHLENGYSIEYPVWKESSTASFEDPTEETQTEEGDVRFHIAAEDWQEVLNIIEADK